MTIDEAIEILMKQRYSFPTEEMRVINNALNLGTEALKAIKLTRGDSSLGRIVLLAGETEEQPK